VNNYDVNEIIPLTFGILCIAIIAWFYFGAYEGYNHAKGKAVTVPEFVVETARFFLSGTPQLFVVAFLVGIFMIFGSSTGFVDSEDWRVFFMFFAGLLIACLSPLLFFGLGKFAGSKWLALQVRNKRSFGHGER
jgi:hypothetical protein